MAYIVHYITYAAYDEPLNGCRLYPRLTFRVKFGGKNNVGVVY